MVSTRGLLAPSERHAQCSLSRQFLARGARLLLSSALLSACQSTQAQTPPQGESSESSTHPGTAAEADGGLNPDTAAGDTFFDEDSAAAQPCADSKRCADPPRSADPERCADSQRGAESQPAADSERGADSQRCADSQRSVDLQRPADFQRSTIAIGDFRVTFGSSWPLPQESATEPLPLDSSWKLARTIAIGKSHLSEVAQSQDGEKIFVHSQVERDLLIYSAESGSRKATRRIPGPPSSAYESFSLVLLDHPLTFEADASNPTGEIAFLYTQDYGYEFLEPEVQRVALAPTWSISRLNSYSSQVLYLSLHDQGAGSLIHIGKLEELRERAGRPTEVFAPGHVGRAQLSASGRYLALLYSMDHLVVLDLRNERIALEREVPQYSRALAISPDDSLLAVGGAALQLIDLNTGSVQSEDHDYQNNAHEARFTSDGKLLLVSAYDGRARSYTLTHRDLSLKQALPHRGQANVYALSLNGDESQLITSSGDQTLKIWRRSKLAP